MTRKQMHHSFTMEELPSEPLALRCNVISLFAKYTSSSQARGLEHECHKHRASQVEKPIPKWTQNSFDLFITDGPDKHAHCARNAYNDNVLVVLAKLKCKMSLAEADGLLENPKTGLFQEWTSQLESNLAFAKKVLEEKESSTKGIFQCPHCKSYDVDTEQKQTRSADEPMTIFCHCTVCNKRFVR